VDSLESSVEVSDEHHQMFTISRSSIGISQPVADKRWDFRERWRRHPASKGPDVVLAKRARPFTCVKALRRRVQPRWLDDQSMDLAQLCQVDPLTGRPVRGLFDCLRIDPPRRLGIALNLEVVGEFLASDRLPLT
jgi:hypothetical protein